jgi:hypothetical protein
MTTLPGLSAFILIFLPSAEPGPRLFFLPEAGAVLS